MIGTRCPHGAEFPLEPCSPCQRERADEQLHGSRHVDSPPRVVVGPSFEAAHETTCPGCGFDVSPGQTARMVSRFGRPGRAHHDGACTREHA